MLSYVYTTQTYTTIHRHTHTHTSSMNTENTILCIYIYICFLNNQTKLLCALSVIYEIDLLFSEHIWKIAHFASIGAVGDGRRGGGGVGGQILCGLQSGASAARWWCSVCLCVCLLLYTISVSSRLYAPWLLYLIFLRLYVRLFYALTYANQIYIDRKWVAEISVAIHAQGDERAEVGRRWARREGRRRRNWSNKYPTPCAHTLHAATHKQTHSHTHARTHAHTDTTRPKNPHDDDDDDDSARQSTHAHTTRGASGDTQMGRIAPRFGFGSTERRRRRFMWGTARTRFAAASGVVSLESNSHTLICGVAISTDFTRDLLIFKQSPGFLGISLY